MISFTPFPELITDRLTLRQFGIEDEEAIFTLRTDPEVNGFTNRARPNDMVEVRQFIAKIRKGIADNEMISWGIYMKDSKQLIGSIGYWQFNETQTQADIGYELLPEYWGNGIMHEAFAATQPFVFGPMALEKVEAWVNVANTASIKFLERNKFQMARRVPKGEFGDPTDMFIYHLERSHI